MESPRASQHALLEMLWRERMHTDPQAIELAPAPVRQAFGSIWEPAERIRGYLERLPAGLLSLWLERPRGHLVFTHLPSGYHPGLYTWRGREFEGVCTICTADLAQQPCTALVAVGDLIDHLLGSGLETGGAWLADGLGLTEGLRELAPRLARLRVLGYATPHDITDTPRSYFSRAFALYLVDSAGLNVTDPLAYRFFHHALLSDAWWRGMPG